MAVGIYGKQTYEKERWVAYLAEAVGRLGGGPELYNLEAPEGEVADKAIFFSTGRLDELDFAWASSIQVPRQWVFYPVIRECKVNERYLRYRLQEAIRPSDSIVSVKLDERDAAVMIEHCHDGRNEIRHLGRELAKALNTQAAWILDKEPASRWQAFRKKGGGL